MGWAWVHALVDYQYVRTCLFMDDICNYVKNGDDVGGLSVKKIIKTEVCCYV